jgi:predicted DNA-binding transcriptional regulator
MKSATEKPKAASRKPARASATAEASRAKTTVAVASPPAPAAKDAHALQWTFLTNHAHVLVLLSRNPSLVLREVALQVGITERAVQRIIADLEAGGILEREKVGRQNHYLIQTDLPLRHAIEAHKTIGDLLALINDESE